MEEEEKDKTIHVFNHHQLHTNDMPSTLLISRSETWTNWAPLPSDRGRERSVKLELHKTG